LTGRKPGGGKNSGWRFIQEAQQNQAAEKSNEFDAELDEMPKVKK
jgi:hypothetical protein